MTEGNIGRERIVDALIDRLEPLEFVDAMWEGGAAAHGRVDEWSDLDLQVVCDDEKVEETFETAREALDEVASIELAFRMPEPAWHGHSQVFWKLREASPFHLIDLCVIKRSSDDKFLEPEMHGSPEVHFDKTGVARPASFDVTAHREALRRRLGTLRTVFGLFGRVMVEKELRRGNGIEAVSYFHGTTLRPLIEVLRMRYTPAQHRFHTRYLYYDFPHDVVKRLERLFFVGDIGELDERLEEAVAWFEVAAEEAERFLSAEDDERPHR
ncbi:MAG: nucleotidyltransferase domain-containing protein [Candidatus Eisenbacteria bacterium]|nr:nucleotidyltransferase domain-containing protein [Candidatus Eisenbacteria bacterium]